MSMAQLAGAQPKPPLCTETRYQQLLTVKHTLAGPTFTQHEVLEPGRPGAAGHVQQVAVLAEVVQRQHRARVPPVHPSHVQLHRCTLSDYGLVCLFTGQATNSAGT